ncbi:hypothetical protein IW262DRAFT_1536618 [Armillaria fumosa]|nr:hypothetical protein IW262DRAFT_1536618 [Armillaria fumosa]
MNYITSTDNIAQDLLRISQAAGQTKLQCWGVSYTTVLGSTFASIFPVRSLVYYIFQATNFSSNLKDKIDRKVLDDRRDDTDKGMQSFLDGCLAAGPDRSTFYSPITTEISNSLDPLCESVLAQAVPFLTTHPMSSSTILS